MLVRSKGHRIFSERSLSEFLDGILVALKSEASELGLDAINDEATSTALVERWSVPLLQLLFDQASTTVKEVPIPAEWFPASFFVTKGKKYPKPVVTVHLPYVGLRDLLFCSPSSRLLWSEEVEISASEISFDFIMFRDDPDEINRDATRLVENIKQQFEHVTQETAAFNARLPAEVARAVAERKAKLESVRRAVAGLAFPLRASPESVAAAPSVRTTSPIARAVPRKVVQPAATAEPRVDAARGMASVFISYGSPDEAFAQRLSNDLRSRGLRVFFFKDSALAGKKLHRVMREGVNTHDRVVLVCSRRSLGRPGVLNEIEESLQREAREGGTTIIIPIALDDYVFGEWAPARPDIAQSVRDRVVADFRGADTDNSLFLRGCERLAEAITERECT